MKKKHLVTALASLVLLTGCGAANNEKANELAKNNQVPQEDSALVEERVIEGKMASLGYAFDVNIKGKSLEGEKGPEAQANGHGLAIVFDEEGKIVDAKFDVIQPKVVYSDDLSLMEEKQEFQSKIELGDEYGMKKISSIDKEWYQQAQAFEEYIIGKTAEEVSNIPTKAKDKDHQNVADDPDLITSVTIDIGEFMKLVQEASENTIDISGAEKIALNLDAKTSKSKGLEGEMGPKASMSILLGVVAMDNEGKIVASIIDEAEPKMEFTTEGEVIETETQVKTKRDLGDEYGMKEASNIQKEWYEQMDALEEYFVGKSLDEVKEIPTKVEGEDKMTSEAPDLTSSVTIDIKEAQKLILDVMER